MRSLRAGGLPRRLRTAVLLLAGGSILALGPVAVGPVTPAEAAGCRAPQVAVAVDFGHWGGSVERGCASSGHDVTGVGALQQAGFDLTGTARYGLAFVCRIDDHPGAAAEKCVNTPPATAYWAYWHADAGQTSWTYSTTGAAQYHPQPGGADAWTFGATDAAGTPETPTFSPAEVLPAPAIGPGPTSPTSTPVARSPTPRPRTSAPRAPGHRTSLAPETSATSARAPVTSATRPAHPPAGAAASAATAVGSAGTSAAAASADTGSPAGTSGVAGPGATSAGPVIVDHAASSAVRGAGSPWPTVLGLGIVAVLAVGGLLAARRRRGHPR